MATGNKHDNQESFLPNKLLIDSSSIHLALSQPGAHPSNYKDDKQDHSLDRIQRFVSSENVNESFDTSISNEVLFKESCYYCSVDSYISGIITLNWSYIFFNPDFLLVPNNKAPPISSLFIPIDNFDIVEWATTFIPENIDSRPQGWELKLFYSLKLNSTDATRAERFRTNNKDFISSRVSNGVDSSNNVPYANDNLTPTDRMNSIQLPNEFEEPKNLLETLQYETCSIFVFDSFDKLDRIINFLNMLLRDKPCCMQIDFNSSALAIDTYMQSTRNSKQSKEVLSGYNKLKDSYYDNLYFKFEEDSLVKPLLEHDLLLQLGQHLPVYLTNCTLSIAFSPLIHGISFSTFYRILYEQGPFVLLIKDDGGSIFGAFVEKFELHNQYYGTDKNFVFTFRKYQADDDEAIRVFYATSKNNFFIYSDSQTIAIGGGGHYAITIEKSFYQGSSTECTTFNNEPLSSTTDFKIKDLQIWKFVSPLN